MASKKKTTKRKNTGKALRECKPMPELKKLLAKAQAEIANLLKDQRAGTLAQEDLKAGLTETKQHLDELAPFDVYTKH
jgi:hypothetical protein